MASTVEPKHAGQVQSSDGWGDWLRISIPAVIIVVVVAIAWHFLQPAPPGRVVIATGSREGVYHEMATRYADFFAENGVILEVRETAGSAENFKLLTAAPGTTPGGDVDIAIVQGGSSPPRDQIPHIKAVAGIYYEPVLLFTHGSQHIKELTELAGKKIAIGGDGSGVRVLANMLLNEAGIADDSAGTKLVTLGGSDAADALTKGDIDAAFFVISPDAPIVARLLGTPDIHLTSLDQTHAYGRRHPFLSATTLYQGAVDSRKNMPDADTDLVATPATIVVRDSTHSAIIELLVRAAQEFNGGTTLLAEAGTFPTADRSELPVSKDAKYFLKNPPGFLRRTLPFWLASMIDRLVILIVPLLFVLIPLVRTTPTLLRWRVQRKIFHRYRRVRLIEERLHAASSREELQDGRDELVAMDKSLATLKIPISFAEELYNLRNNVSYVRGQIDAWLLHNNGESATAAQ